jgi:hypothetical protein
MEDNPSPPAREGQIMRACSRRVFVHGVLGAALAVWTTGSPAVAGQPSVPADENLVIGTWHLNVAKSKYRPGPGPKSQTRTYEAHPNGVKATVRTVDADGHSTSVEYVAKYDRVEYPIMGSAEADAIALNKIDAYTAEASLTHAGKVIGTARRVISPDGKTMTITFRDSRGTINNVAVYEKQEK